MKDLEGDGFFFRFWVVRIPHSGIYFDLDLDLSSSSCLHF